MFKEIFKKNKKQSAEIIDICIEEDSEKYKIIITDKKGNKQVFNLKNSQYQALLIDLQKIEKKKNSSKFLIVNKIDRIKAAGAGVEVQINTEREGKFEIVFPGFSKEYLLNGIKYVIDKQNKKDG